MSEVYDQELPQAESSEIVKAPTELDEVSSMYPLLVDIAPEDWEDASGYEKSPSERPTAPDQGRFSERLELESHLQTKPMGTG